MVDLSQRQTFLDAGLPEPQLRAHGPILSDQWGLGFLVATLRSALPNLVQSGAMTEEEVGMDTLEGRLRDEFARQRGIGIPGFFIDAWTRKPEAAGQLGA